MKKRVLCMIMVVLIVIFSVRNSNAIVGYVVGQIVAGSAIVAGSSLLIPALVNGPSGKSAWVSLAVSMANAVSMAATVSIAAIAAGHSILKNAILGFVGSTKGATAVENGVVGYKVVSYTVPSGWVQIDTPYVVFGYFATFGAAQTFQATLPGYQGLSNKGTYSGVTVYQGLYHPAGFVYSVFYVTATPPPNNYTFNPYSAADLGTELTAGAAAGDQAALNVLRAAWEEFHENMAGRSSTLSPTVVAAGKTVLNNAITQAQADTIAGVTPKTPEEIAADAGTAALTAGQMQAAVAAALAGQGLSAAQIQAAVSAALALNAGLTPAQVQAAMTAALTAAGTGMTPTQMQAAVEAALLAKGLTATGVQSAVDAAIKANPAIIPAYVPTTLPVAYVQPAVGDFKTRTQTFISTIQASSVFGLPVLMASSIPADSGSCEYTVNLSDRFGGSKTVSFCNWATGLAAIHAVLMILAGWAAVRIVVKGGA